MPVTVEYLVFYSDFFFSVRCCCQKGQRHFRVFGEHSEIHCCKTFEILTDIMTAMRGEHENRRRRSESHQVSRARYAAHRCLLLLGLVMSTRRCRCGEGATRTKRGKRPKIMLGSRACFFFVCLMKINYMIKIRAVFGLLLIFKFSPLPFDGTSWIPFLSMQKTAVAK